MPQVWCPEIAERYESTLAERYCASDLDGRDIVELV